MDPTGVDPIWLLVAGQLAALSGLLLLGLVRLTHALALLRAGPRAPEPPPPPPTAWPSVTVQLPVFEEAAVVGRLLAAVARLDYPRERLEVQVLDDSQDETADLLAAGVADLRRQGIAAHHLRRPTRAGYKAGALAAGLEQARGELVALFDADFLPPPDFLRRAVPWFQDPRVGLVQAAWGHENRAASLLTRLQALLLDAHFQVEQAARDLQGGFVAFNGTAGVLRRAAIEDAGGWSADTLTEDLDLALRAQLCGWRFRFLPDLVVPAELPEDGPALRAQQQRWTRGAAATTRKLLRLIWRAPGLRTGQRLSASALLLQHAAWPLLLLLLLGSAAIAALPAQPPPWFPLAQALLFALASGSVALAWAVGQRARGARGVLEALALAPLLFALGFGLCAANARAWWQGLRGGAAAFARTPKRGDARAPRYAVARALPLAELLLGLVCAGACGAALARERPAALPFLLLMAAGLLGWGLTLLRPARSRAPRPSRTASDPVRTISRTPLVSAARAD